MAFEGESGANGSSAIDVLTGGNGGAGGGTGGDPAGGAGAGEGSGAAGDLGGAPAGSGGDAGASSFLEQFPAETLDGESASLRDWVSSTGVKDIAGLAKIARDNQRAVRESGRVRIPGENASAEEVAAWRKATGVPDTVEGYAIDPVTGADGEPVPLNAPLLDRLAAKAHELGVPAATYKGLVNDFVQSQIEEFSAAEATQRAEATEWMKAQGERAPARSAAVNRGAEALGLGGEDVLKLRNALGAKRALDTLARLGEGIGEDVVTDLGGGSRFLMSGDQAQNEINAMRADPAVLAKMTVKGTPEYAKYTRLLEIAGQAANRRAAAGG